MVVPRSYSGGIPMRTFRSTLLPAQRLFIQNTAELYQQINTLRGQLCIIARELARQGKAQGLQRAGILDDRLRDCAAALGANAIRILVEWQSGSAKPANPNKTGR